METWFPVVRDVVLFVIAIYGAALSTFNWRQAGSAAADAQRQKRRRNARRHGLWKAELSVWRRTGRMPSAWL
jgi:protein-S-isoprenylcysteine O-methyltransferase Ste14